MVEKKSAEKKHYSLMKDLFRTDCKGQSLPCNFFTVVLSKAIGFNEDQPTDPRAATLQVLQA